MRDGDLESTARELYALPLSEFTAQRNARAKGVRGEDRDLADAIGRLPKPSTAAWAVNMLVVHRRDQVDQLLELGGSLRDAQQNLDAAALRELAAQRRRLVSALARQARSVALDLGQSFGDSVLTEIEQSLNAAMLDADAADAVRSGTLLRALEAVGFGSVEVTDAVAVPGAAPAPARPTAGTTSRRAAEPARDEVAAKREQAERRRRLQQAKAELSDAEHAARVAAKRADDAARAADDAIAARDELVGELDELRRRIAELDDRLDDAETALRRARRDHDTAANDAMKADRDVERARAHLAELD